MKFLKNLSWNIFTNGVREDYDDDVKRKILLMNLMSEIAIIVLVILSFSNLSSNLILLFAVDLAAALTLIGLLIYLRFSGDYKLVSLIGIYLLALLFFFFFATGGVSNTGYLWYYTFPLFSISILGCKRGMQSVCILLAPSFYLLFYEWPQLTTYSFDFKTRFIPSIIVVTIFAYILEKTREKKEKELRNYRNHLEKLVEKRTQKLEKALAEVKILRGILPICMHCKKIRDDNGYWNQIESYIRDHSEAEFTHSICSECVEELYPELVKNSSPEREEGSYNEQRKARRVPVPERTSCVISVENKSPDKISVKDISLTGMLLYDAQKEDEYQTDTCLNGLWISIPDRSGVEENGFFFIDKAKIVRSFVDDTSQTVCYGIEFIDLDSYGREQITSLVNTPYH